VSWGIMGNTFYKKRKLARGFVLNLGKAAAGL
jgi:hypothetical protein